MTAEPTSTPSAANAVSAEAITVRILESERREPNHGSRGDSTCPSRTPNAPALHPEVPARAGPISAATTRDNLPRAAAAIERCGDFRNDLRRSTADAAWMVGVALDVLLKHVVIVGA